MSEPHERGSRRGLLCNITGAGKGKTTGALGAAFRALGWGWQVTMVQFVKDSRPTGEQQISLATKLPFKVLPMGRGFSWDSRIDAGEHVQAAREAWTAACCFLKDDATDLLILDELNVALHLGWLQIGDILSALHSRPDWKHVIITGRNAPEELVDASDMVSEIREVKHPFQRGIKAQPGIEY